MDAIHIVLKVAERCNLACTYCYFFFGGDESYKVHSPVIKQETIDSVAAFLRQGCADLCIKDVHIYFHGGEPLLMKKQLFDYMCSVFKDSLDHLNLSLYLQTNALLVDAGWVELFGKHDIRVGVSIDGNKEQHDRYRIDHKGRGSYDRAIEKVRYMQEAVTQGKINQVGCLSVISGEHNGSDIYRHIVHTLGIRGVDFLLPDYTHDTFYENALDYGRFLCQAFDSWVRDSDLQIDVRFFASTIAMLLGKNSRRLDLAPDYNEFASITISSDADLRPDDTLLSTKYSLMHTGKTTANSSLREYLQEPIFQQLGESSKIMPAKCQECCWINICKGGQPVHRYSHANNFNNPSVMCEGLKMFYAHVAQYLVDNGLPYSFIQARLLEKV